MAGRDDAREPIRLVFELARGDHPRLYDELIRFPKGTKRINRLRVLAYDGLLAQGVLLAQPSSAEGRDGRRAQGGGAQVTDDVFGPASPE